MTRTAVVIGFVLLALLDLPRELTAVPRARALTAVDLLSDVYHLILDTRFDRVDSALTEACGPAPDEACLVLRAAATWWQIQMDPHSRALDERFQQEVDAAIAATGRWTEREPEDAEAWFYHGGAYGARVSWRVERGERLAAARDGKQIKEALERALELNPTLVDARFGIGLYQYYADVAPPAARFLRFLLMLPGGDREEGLRHMEATHAHGALLRGEADYQLHWIYLWYEDQPARALGLLDSLGARYPANALFVKRIAEVQAEYFHDSAASLATWRVLAERAASFGTPLIAEVNGRLGMAARLDALEETDLAVVELQRVLRMAPTQPYAATARAWVRLGQGLDRLGRREAAERAYRAALDVAPDPDPFDIARQARDGLSERPDPREGLAYRLALDGWRALQHGRIDEAERELTRAAALAPANHLTQVRAARVAQQQGRTAAALATYEEIIDARPDVSPLALAPALLWSGEILEARGHRTAALDRYRAAERVFGADSRIARKATAALSRE